MERIRVSVIIPTICSKARAASLTRAIDSVFLSVNLYIQVIVVVNGEKYDLEAIKALNNDSRLTIIMLPVGNVSLARYEGLMRSAGEFFCFLDDDDELLPDGLTLRANFLKNNNAVDVVVSNGFVSNGGEDIPLVASDKAEQINANKEKAFLEQNWFASCAPLFRASSINPEIFKINLKHFEWTYIFFLLVSLNINLHFIGTVGYRKYEDNQDSVSKSSEYFMAYPGFLLKLFNLNISLNVKKIIRKKYLTALNGLAKHELSLGLLRRAWGTHFKCVARGGWGFLPFTRHLVMALFRSEV